MRHRTSSSDGSSTTSSPTNRQTSFNHPPRPTSRSRHSASQPSHPSPFGPLATLIRLAIFAAILAFTVPYIKPYIFGSSSSTNSSSTSDLVKNATADLRARKNSYHHIINNNNNNNNNNDNESIPEGEIDVFNFSHEDYLSSAKELDKDDGRKSSKAVAKASAVDVVAPSQPKTRSSSSVKRSKSNSRSTKQHLNIHSPSSSSSSSSSDDFDEDDHHNQPSNLTTITNILSTLFHLLITLFQFILIIPLTHILHFTLYLISSLHHLTRSAISHIIRPIIYISAPLTYLISGIFFIFIFTPYDLASTIANELYPVYIFLGAATVVGIAMGLVAAGVMYLSAFIFVDRILPTKPKIIYQNDSSQNSTPKNTYPSFPFHQAQYSPSPNPPTSYRPNHPRNAFAPYSSANTIRPSVA